MLIEKRDTNGSIVVIEDSTGEIYAEIRHTYRPGLTFTTYEGLLLECSTEK